VVGRDGNGVDVDRERAAFTENALRYEASVNMINGQVKRLLSVIQG
jgi:flagellar basal-body rod protein FlgB